MHLVLVGISHRTAPVELRERIDFQARGLEVSLRALAQRAAVREAVVLSTCNRAELYGVSDDPNQGGSAFVDFITDFHKVDRQALPRPEHSALDTTFIAPRTTTQQALATIWAEVLHSRRDSALRLSVGVCNNYAIIREALGRSQ